MNKYFIDVICNKVWSSFELLSEVNHQRKEEEKEKILRVTFYHSVCVGGRDWKRSESSKVNLGAANELNGA